MGGFYFTDLGKRYKRHRDHGGLYYALPDGSSRSARSPIYSSHRTASACRRTDDLYVADTESARLWAFDIESPGVGPQRRLLPLLAWRPASRDPAGFCRFDSMAVEASGNIAVATLLAGSITVFSPAGEVVHSVAMPDTHPTKSASAAEDMRTAYVTLSRPRRGIATLPGRSPACA